MSEKDSKTLEHISETLDEVLAEIKKPRHKFLRIIDIAAAGITVLGIINIVEKALDMDKRRLILCFKSL